MGSTTQLQARGNRVVGSTTQLQAKGNRVVGSTTQLQARGEKGARLWGVPLSCRLGATGVPGCEEYHSAAG